MYRNLITKYTGTCADCGAELPTGSKARYYGRGRLYGEDYHGAAYPGRVDRSRRRRWQRLR